MYNYERDILVMLFASSFFKLVCCSWLEQYPLKSLEIKSDLSNEDNDRFFLLNLLIFFSSFKLETLTLRPPNIDLLRFISAGWISSRKVWASQIDGGISTCFISASITESNSKRGASFVMLERSAFSKSFTNVFFLRENIGASLVGLEGRISSRLSVLDVFQSSLKKLI